MDLAIQYLASGIVVVTLGGSATPEEAHEKLERLRAEYASWHEPHSVVFDVARVENATAQLRKIVGEWRARNAVLLKTKFYSASYVIPSSLLRGVFTAMDWIATPDVARTKYCSTLEEAMAQAEAWERERRENAAS